MKNLLLNYINKITKLLTDYKASVNALESKYFADKETVVQKAEANRGKWLPEYIAEYIAENDPKVRFEQEFKRTQADTKGKVENALSLISLVFDSYFNAPISEAFANKITAIKLSGIQLTNREFANLEKDANTFMERRILQHIAESRTKESSVASYDNKSGDMKREKTAVANPYMGLYVPNPDIVYDSFAEFERNAIRMVNQYSGAKGTFAKSIGIPTDISITSDAYMRNHVDESFARVLDKYPIENTSLPKLTTEERETVDEKVNPTYPSLAREAAAEVAIKDSEMAVLLIRDKRYSQTVIEALTNN